MPDSHRIKMKWPNGLEFEAEGSPKFVSQERREFLERLAAARQPLEKSPERVPNEPEIAWEAITEAQGPRLQLRAKLGPGKSEKEACLVLLAASERLLGERKPTAAQLARWLRGSGYPIQRMDRALQDGVKQGEILSSGSRRARRYELTASGRLRAFILADQLSTVINGKT
ncbi:MAG: hypothetical protein HY549_08865 [Elusimicrobia bacterium]|nr:hypothetical protein [Elusimicrobiota bacterium]